VTDPLSGLKLAAGDELMHTAYLLAITNIQYGPCRNYSYGTVLLLLRISHAMYIPSLVLSFYEPIRNIFGN